MEILLVQFVGSIAAAYVICVAVWPLLKSRGRRNLSGAGLAIAAIAVCPAIVPSEHIMARAFACLVCIDPLFRVVDYARQVRQDRVDPITCHGYWTFLIPFPFLLTVYGEKQRIIQAPQIS